jgi:pyridoxine/pyridoxamine 5'-phosphate oxidase
MSDKKNNNNLFVERRPEGDYAVRKPNADRASAVAPTQAKAIERAKELNPNAAVHVERVRNTNVGSPDKWRKP